MGYYTEENIAADELQIMLWSGSIVMSRTKDRAHVLATFFRIREFN